MNEKFRVGFNTETLYVQSCNIFHVKSEMERKRDCKTDHTPVHTYAGVQNLIIQSSFDITVSPILYPIQDVSHW